MLDLKSFRYCTLTVQRKKFPRWQYPFFFFWKELIFTPSERKIIDKELPASMFRLPGVVAHEFSVCGRLGQEDYNFNATWMTVRSCFKRERCLGKILILRIIAHAVSLQSTALYL